MSYMDYWFSEKIPVPLTRMEILILIGSVIFAADHPANTGPSKSYAKDAAKKMTELIKDDPQVMGNLAHEWTEFFKEDQ